MIELKGRGHVVPFEELSMRCCEPDICEFDSYDMDIEADDIGMTDTVTVIWNLLDD